MKIFGIILIAIGVIMFVVTGISYTTEETIIDAGPIEVSADKENEVNWPPYAGGVAVLAGLLVVAMARKK
ncbi:hypothetical protein ADIS_0585 [Lunatimonas lonarensis]|uniref:Uncharacterized protein n=1 Tax=Lunatimonas lonarensis TaxID=1232681 RepID=R7ZY50_9BACT|nr:hypothetical protein [Lunatimonas lonarensis]EON78992.1 hypothetical protein ADIS_0585 [Lunatimonas lonarensis]